MNVKNIVFLSKIKNPSFEFIYFSILAYICKVVDFHSLYLVSPVLDVYGKRNTKYKHRHTDILPTVTVVASRAVYANIKQIIYAITMSLSKARALEIKSNKFSKKIQSKFYLNFPT